MTGDIQVNEEGEAEENMDLWSYNELWWNLYTIEWKIIEGWVCWVLPSLPTISSASCPRCLFVYVRTGKNGWRVKKSSFLSSEYFPSSTASYKIPLVLWVSLCVMREFPKSLTFHQTNLLSSRTSKMTLSGLRSGVWAWRVRCRMFFFWRLNSEHYQYGLSSKQIDSTWRSQ